MSRAQIDSCAARLTPADAAQFRALLAASAALFGQAVQLRRQAWVLYRAQTGLTVAGKRQKKHPLGGCLP